MPLVFKSVSLLLVGAFALTACGGGDAGPSPTVEPAQAATFRSYAQSARDGDGTALSLSEAERTDVARFSRTWTLAVMPMRPDDGNDLVLPPLHFARLQVVAAAASGTTLAELQPLLPAATKAVAQLMQGIERELLAGPDVPVTASFMDAAMERQQPATFSKLAVSPLSAASLAAEPNLRLRVRDAVDHNWSWPHATRFAGVFEDDKGYRSVAPMLRIDGQLRSVAYDDMQLTALALPSDRWLVRITATRGVLSQWGGDGLDRALQRVAADLVGPRAPAAAAGQLILPELGIGAGPIVYGRGLDEALQPTRADLRALDGKGGTYAKVSDVTASLAIQADRLTVRGDATTEFIFSPNNPWSGGANNTVSGYITYADCNATDLHPAYLAVVNAAGGIEMLARYVRVDSTQPCR